MRKETRELLAKARDADALEVVARGAERARARAAAAPPTGLPQTLPLGPTVLLFTMTEAELHDTTYHAVSTYLAGLSSMSKTRAHEHAGRIAAAAVRNATASDYAHRGKDPNQ